VANIFCEEKRFSSREEIRAFVKKVTRSKWWRERTSLKSKEVKLWFRGTSLARGGLFDQYKRESNRGYGIRLTTTTWSWTKPTILHELMHVIVNHYKYSKNSLHYETGHGPFFAAMLYLAIERFMGKRAAKRLYSKQAGS